MSLLEKLSQYAKRVRGKNSVGGKMKNIGIIGGSGIYQLGVEIVREHEVLTPFGNPSAKIVEGRLSGVTCFFLPRHGTDHAISPSEVNYRANIFALKKLGVEYVISVSAVGSLQVELPPTTFVLVDQFIDWTKGLRERTFFKEGMVGHVSCAEPVSIDLQKILGDACRQASVTHAIGGSYICIEGPLFSSKAESKIYQSFQASVIGMTNVPEAYLAKEAGMAYATMAMVTDYDCIMEDHCTLEEIMKVMKTNNENALKVLKIAVSVLNEQKFDVKKENAFALLTKKEILSGEQRAILEVLMK